ncbi:MAG: cysteine peptidase family C39 domain-containing protein, partial [Mastigocoleus sp. MO_167.B18]|nr:cysteine peptidase family C39 domain-containing protein [Mastigocoleus sp. MO_167.B18]
MLSLFKKRTKYECIRQNSEEDCGAACLASVCKYYGQIISINRSREAVGTGQYGTTLLGLKRGAESLGFNARSVKASPAILDKLQEMILPTIIHWQGRHWVVLYGKSGKKYVIADPAFGLRYLSRQELKEAWDGIALLLEPGNDFSKSSLTSDASQEGFGRFFKRVWRYRNLLIQVLVVNLVLGLL